MQRQNTTSGEYGGPRSVDQRLEQNSAEARFSGRRCRLSLFAGG